MRIHGAGMSVPGERIFPMRELIRISDLKYFAEPRALATAAVLASEVSVLELDSDVGQRSRVQGLVPSDPSHIAEISTTWPGRFRCTCGARAGDSLAAASLCEHTAAVLVSVLTSTRDDPHSALEDVRMDADLAVALGQAWEAILRQAVLRDAEGTRPLEWVTSEVDWAGVNVTPAQLSSSLERLAAPEQFEMFLLHEVEWLLGEDGEGDLDPSSSGIAATGDLLSGVSVPHTEATVPARLLAARRVRSAIGPSTGPHDLLVLRYRDLMDLGALGGEVRRDHGARIAREVVALEERHRPSQRPLVPDLAVDWNDAQCAAALDEARRRIDGLLLLVDGESDDELAAGDHRPEPLVLHHHEGFYVEHRFPDQGRGSAQIVRERLQRLWRVAADIAFAARDADALARALRGWSDPDLGEYFHRARRWSADAQAEIAMIAEERYRLVWIAESSSLPGELPDSSEPFHSRQRADAQDVSVLYDLIDGPGELKSLAVEDAVAALSAAGREDDAKSLLVRHLSREPDPHHVEHFARGWRRAELPGDPIEVAHGILAGWGPATPAHPRIPDTPGAPG